MIDLPRDKSLRNGRDFFSFKWKIVIALTAVLGILNGAFVYLVHRGNVSLYESLHEQKLSTQANDFTKAMNYGLESLSAFGSFIPHLSTPQGQRGEDLSSTIMAVLEEHGIMLDLEWGVSAARFLEAGGGAEPSVVWPIGNLAPIDAVFVDSVLDKDSPQAKVSCLTSCYQSIALPVLADGETAGVLLVERPFSEVLRNFYDTSGVNAAMITSVGRVEDSGQDAVNSKVRIAAVTQPESMRPVVRSFVSEYSIGDLRSGPRRMKVGDDWYEAFSVSGIVEQPHSVVLVFNRVTEQIAAIQRVTHESFLVGLIGMVLSESVLLILLWHPLRRVQDVVFSLPLFSMKLYSRFRSELPKREESMLPPDEIDLMYAALWNVSEQMEELDEAHQESSIALKESEQRLAAAQSMAGVSSWVGEPLGGAFRFLPGCHEIDPALRSVSTWDEFISLVHPEDRSWVRIVWRRGLPGRKLDAKFRLLLGERLVHVHAVAEYEHVKRKFQLRAIGMMQDVTEIENAKNSLENYTGRLESEVRKRTRDLVAARNVAERTAKQKSEFLARMSHEIRTPLNAVLGLSQVGFRQNVHRKAAETFRQILDSGEHLLNVVNDVLDHAKLEAGKMNIVPANIAVNDLVERCCQMVRQRAEEKSLRLECAVEKGCPSNIMGDSFRIQQIVINLLSNAVKFTEDGGVSLTVDCLGDRLEFRVSDTGVGMTREQIGRLFVPYQQAHAERSVSVEGTGLGLSISNQIAGLMGGEIRVRSHPGKGSEFVLLLPCLEADAETGGAGSRRVIKDDPGEGCRLSGLRILIADDGALNRGLVEQLLALEGAEVVGVHNGEEALHAVVRESTVPYHCILMDIEMPGMDGRAATRHLRDAKIATPIVGLSAHADPEERLRCLEVGMDEQLVKPVMQDELVSAILRFVADDNGAREQQGTVQNTA